MTCPPSLASSPVQRKTRCCSSRHCLTTERWTRLWPTRGSWAYRNTSIWRKWVGHSPPAISPGSTTHNIALNTNESKYLLLQSHDFRSPRMFICFCRCCCLSWQWTKSTWLKSKRYIPLGAFRGISMNIIKKLGSVVYATCTFLHMYTPSPLATVWSAYWPQHSLEYSCNKCPLSISQLLMLHAKKTRLAFCHDTLYVHVATSMEAGNCKKNL